MHDAASPRSVFRVPLGRLSLRSICVFHFRLDRSSTLLLAAFWYIGSSLNRATQQGLLCGDRDRGIFDVMLLVVDPVNRHQMIARDGLASVACDSRTARVLMGVAVIMDLLSCYLILTEVCSSNAAFSLLDL